MTASIHAIGVGLAGDVAPSLRALVQSARLVVGSARLLAAFPEYAGPRVVLGDLLDAIAAMQQVAIADPESNAPIVVLASGDPLFFGIGSLLLDYFPAERLHFHPHVSAVQLAFSRLRLPWQEATVVSAHGRSLAVLVEPLQKLVPCLAVLTDRVNSPAAIANFLQDLQLPAAYRLWVCENLGSDREQVWEWTETCRDREVSPLNVVVLQRQPDPLPLPHDLPLFGLPDAAFWGFSHRPGLITKREMRVLNLGELRLHPHYTVWDIGAGTGSVAVETARLVTQGQVYAIEKTASGITAIRRNRDRFATSNLHPIYGNAPAALANLPDPHRIFLGGSGDRLTDILALCAERLLPNGRLVANFTSPERACQAMQYLRSRGFRLQQMHVNLSRSATVGETFRLVPLNPITILTGDR